MIFNKTDKKLFMFSFYLIISLCVVLIFASQGISKLRSVSLAEARKMAENIKTEKAFKINVNESVVKEMNYYLGTPRGRDFMRNALIKMSKHRKQVTEKLSKYGAPHSLIAVAIVESGFRNLPQTKNRSAAGLWQFIPATAKKFGLRVDNKIDERLDIGHETDAAARYLMANHLRFKDWRLAVLAYNAGAPTVQKGIDSTGSRDPWVIIKAGFENDRNYLSKVMAALIIMHNSSEFKI